MSKQGPIWPHRDWATNILVGFTILMLIAIVAFTLWAAFTGRFDGTNLCQ